MEIRNSLKHDFIKLLLYYFESLLVEKCTIGMNSKDFKTELGGQ